MLLSDVHFQHRLVFDLISEIFRNDLSLIQVIQNSQQDVCDTLYSVKIRKIRLSILLTTVKVGKLTGKMSIKREKKSKI